MNARNAFRTSLSAAAAIAMLGGAARAADPGAAPDLVRRVSAAYAVVMHGVVGLRTHTDLTIDGPMYHRHLPSAPWYVYNDGELVRSSEQQDARRPLVRDALFPTYLPEYRFAFATCTSCAPGEVEVDYESPEHDAFHAHGYFIIDTVSERVRRSVEIPYELPWPTHDGRLETIWGETEAKQWLPRSIVGTFAGKLGPFTGVAHFTQELSAYERYTQVQTAVDSLAAETGATPAPDPPVPQPSHS